MIEINNLTRKFGDAVVSENISMSLEPRHIYGLAGRKGSGKNMLLNHILGFVYPTSGSIKIDAKEIGKDIEVFCNEIFRFDKGKLAVHEY